MRGEPCPISVAGSLFSSLNFDDDTDFVNAWKGFIPGTGLESPVYNQNNPCLLEFFSILVKGEEAGKRDQPLSFSLFVKETESSVNIILRNGVLYYKERNPAEADYTFPSISELADDYKSFMLYLIGNNKHKPEGYDKLHQLYDYFDIFDIHWNIVFPL